jgi:lipoprotein-anchoring transpeptidase ErfK/SrfK
MLISMIKSVLILQQGIKCIVKYEIQFAKEHQCVVVELRAQGQVYAAPKKSGKIMKINFRKLLPALCSVVLLSGCTYTGPSFSTFNGKLPGFNTSQIPSNEFIRDYGQRSDGEFTLPAIPVKEMDKQFLRQRVAYVTKEKVGTIVVDVAKRYLYLIEPDGMAIRYGVGVGKQGFEWQGTAYVGWKQEWPKWTPPEEMIARKPELIKYGVDNGGMPPGLDNPLGARALYLFQDGKDTLYRLHGTPIWSSIGTAASSGCIRLINQDIVDLYSRVKGRAKVVVIQ